MLRTVTSDVQVRRKSRLFIEKEVSSVALLLGNLLQCCCLSAHLNFTCCFIGLLYVTDFLQAVSLAPVPHWLFLSLFYGITVSTVWVYDVGQMLLRSKISHRLVSLEILI